MAIVKKATYTRPVPADAKIVTKKRKRFARFRIKNRTIDAPLTKDGKRCQVETDEYYIRYKGTDGKWRRVKGYTDQDATRALALKLETKVARKQEGLADPFEEHTRRPILEHVDDFERHLEAKENTWKHVCETGAKKEARPWGGAVEAAIKPPGNPYGIATPRQGRAPVFDREFQHV